MCFFFKKKNERKMTGFPFLIVDLKWDFWMHFNILFTMFIIFSFVYLFAYLNKLWMEKWISIIDQINISGISYIHLKHANKVNFSLRYVFNIHYMI